MHENVIALPPGLQVRGGKGFCTLAEALAPGDQPWREFPVAEAVGEKNADEPSRQQNAGEQQLKGLVPIHEQQRKVAQDPVPTLQDLHAEADHKQQQKPRAT